jgi:hypothetical protein
MAELDRAGLLAMKKPMQFLVIFTRSFSSIAVWMCWSGPT